MSTFHALTTFRRLCVLDKGSANKLQSTTFSDAIWDTNSHLYLRIESFFDKQMCVFKLHNLKEIVFQVKEDRKDGAVVQFKSNRLKGLERQRACKKAWINLFQLEQRSYPQCRFPRSSLSFLPDRMRRIQLTY